MPIVVAGGATVWQAGATYIGSLNILQDAAAVIVASTEVIGNESANAASWNGATRWQATAIGTQFITISFPANKSVNSWGVYRHNFGDNSGNVTIEAQYSTDGVSWTTLGTQVTPADGDFTTLFQIHGSTVMADFFRLLITGAEVAPFLSNLFFGESVLLFGSPDTGWVPPSVAFADKYITNVSDGGNFVGRSLIRKAMRTSFNISVVEANWALTTWKTILEQVQAHAFYFMWDSVNYPIDVAFCWTDKPVPKPAFSAPNHLTISLSFDAIVDSGLRVTV
jgi:hypothetical protein